MNRILIAVESISPSRGYQHLATKLRGLAEDDCRVLDNLVFLKTQKNLEDVYDFLKGGVVHPQDRFVVMPLAEDTWLAFNAPKEDDCVEHSHVVSGW